MALIAVTREPFATTAWKRPAGYTSEGLLCDVGQGEEGMDCRAALAMTNPRLSMH